MFLVAISPFSTVVEIQRLPLKNLSQPLLGVLPLSTLISSFYSVLHSVFQKRAPVCQAVVQKLSKLSNWASQAAFASRQELLINNWIGLFSLLEVHTSLGLRFEWCKFSLFFFPFSHRLSCTLLGSQIGWRNIMESTFKKTYYNDLRCIICKWPITTCLAW